MIRIPRPLASSAGTSATLSSGCRVAGSSSPLQGSASEHSQIAAAARRSPPAARQWCSPVSYRFLLPVAGTAHLSLCIIHRQFYHTAALFPRLALHKDCAKTEKYPTKSTNYRAVRKYRSDSSRISPASAGVVSSHRRATASCRGPCRVCSSGWRQAPPASPPAE